MNRVTYIIAAIAVSAVITFGLRALPFVWFSGDGKMPDWLKRLGEILPSAVMAVLIIYCLRGAKSDFIGSGLPSIIAVAVVAVSYKWKHHTFVSIVAGTAVYMALIRII